jgi:hypothetical protein
MLRTTWSLILIANREVSAAELRIQTKSLPEFEDKLQPYNLSSSRGSDNPAVDHATAANEWQQLTSCMKGALLTRITGQKWNHWQVSSTHDVKPADMATSSDEVLEFIFPKADRTFSITSTGRVSLYPSEVISFFREPGVIFNSFPRPLYLGVKLRKFQLRKLFCPLAVLICCAGSHRAGNGYQLPRQSYYLGYLYIRRF